MADASSLSQSDANNPPLTPLTFLERAAYVFPHRASLVYGDSRHTWALTLQRCRRLASALLRSSSVLPGDTVSVVAPNIPATYEAHFGVPMAGAVINCIDIHCDSRTISSVLEHSKTKAILVDQDFFPLVDEALSTKQGPSFRRPLIVVIEDVHCKRDALDFALEKGAVEYECFLQRGDSTLNWIPPKNEWESISLCYTSGNSKNPTGVVLSHRAAYLSSLMAVLNWSMKDGAVYLWTLPLFHGNGWCHSWGMAVVAGTNICMRKVTTMGIYSAIAEHDVTHFAGSPVVLNTILNAQDYERVPIKPGVEVMTAGSAPPETVLERMKAEGFRVTHNNGITEIYGTSTVSAWKSEWDVLLLHERGRLKGRQGVVEDFASVSRL